MAKSRVDHTQHHVEGNGEAGETANRVAAGAGVADVVLVEFREYL